MHKLNPIKDTCIPKMLYSFYFYLKKHVLYLCQMNTEDEPELQTLPLMLNSFSA